MATHWRDDRDESERDDRPETLLFCTHCDDHVLRSRWSEHEEHDLVAMNIERYALHDGDNMIDDASRGEAGRARFATRTVIDDEDDEDDEPTVVGAEYDVRIQKNVTWQFTVVAPDRTEAIDMARDEIEYGNAVDAHEVHVDADERDEITIDDPEAEELGW